MSKCWALDIPYEHDPLAQAYSVIGPSTQSEVGRVFGCDRANISCIERRALRKFRRRYRLLYGEPPEDDPLFEYGWNVEVA